MSTVTPDPLAPAPIERHGIRLGDVLFKGVAGIAAVGVAALLGFLTYKIFNLAWPAMKEFGLSFLWTQAWNPNTNVYGALVFIYGTLVTSFIALLLATPLSIAIALFLTELAPKRLAAPIATMVELLAAIPSVVLGLWGILVFGPWIAKHLEPWLQSWFGFLPIFSGDPSQAGVLPAALVLTIMIIPITSAICRELFSRVPRDLSDGSLALGSTRWEAIRKVAIPYAAPGISAAVLLGLGRAFGEAIAVTQVIGGGNSINRSLFPPGDTLASRIASTYRGASSNLEVQSLLYLGAILLVISLITNVSAQLDREQVPEGAKDVDRMSAAEILDPYDITSRSNNLGRRRLTEKLVSVLALLSALFAVLILALVLGTVLFKGLSQLDLDFFTKSAALFGEKGGIADALVGQHADRRRWRRSWPSRSRSSSRSTSPSTPARRPHRSSASRSTCSTAFRRSSSASSSTACSSSATARARSTAPWRSRS